MSMGENTTNNTTKITAVSTAADSMAPAAISSVAMDPPTNIVGKGIRKGITSVCQ
jgi:hypothetical protein